MNERLEPIVDWIGRVPIYHGERGFDLDGDHPDACLCGELDYMRCASWLSGEGTIGGLTVHLDDQGRVAVER